MTGFFAGGHAVDLILVVLVIEAVVLMTLGWRRRRWSAVELVVALGPGGCLLIAVRGALTGAAWPWIALALAASFPLHLADVMRRRS
jgi:hypothetical protein